MTLITDLPALSPYNTSAEFVVQLGATEYKVTGAEIVGTVTTDLSNYISTNNTAVANLVSGKVDISGDTLTGFLTLHANPTANMHAATKQYVDSRLLDKADAIGAILDSAATAVTAAETLETTAIATTDYVAKKVKYEALKKTVVSASTKVLADADRGTIAVDYTNTGTVAITLPLISSLADATRVEFYIVDTGNNAGTNAITINVAGSDNINGASSYTINSDGASVLLASAGGTNWFIKDKVVSATTSDEGAVQLADTNIAKALADAQRVLTASTLGDVLDDRIFKYQEVGTATKTVTEADAGAKLYVTQTNTGTCAVALPNPSTLAAPSRFELEVWDAGNAGTNNITITPAAGTIDGVASLTIDNTKAGLKLFTDGTNYFTVANTARATSEATVSTPNLAAVLAVGSTVSEDITFTQSFGPIYTDSGFTAKALPTTLSANRAYTLPDASGTIALTSDLSSYLALSGGAMSGPVTGLIASGTFEANDLVVFSGSSNLNGPGSVPITEYRANISSTATGNAITLAAGTVGQKLAIVYTSEVSSTDTMILTGALNGYTQIQFNDIGDAVELLYGTGGWTILSCFNATVS